MSKAPRKFGRYVVEQEIGDGAMGRVYRCSDPFMKRLVAVKTVKQEYLTRETAEEYLRRFRREAQAAGRLSHPHIVSIFDVGETYFVMEYLEGTTLQAALAARGKLPLEEALALLSPLAEALDYAHRSSIVHRDIKPANIMVLDDGRPKLMDFGVARLESSVATASGHFFGSPSYMAPEQISGAEVTNRADLFSFAVLAYEVVTGRRPFEGDSITAVMYRVVNTDPSPTVSTSSLTRSPTTLSMMKRVTMETKPLQTTVTITLLIWAKTWDPMLMPSARPDPPNAPAHTPVRTAPTIPPTPCTPKTSRLSSEPMAFLTEVAKM
jgi:serine/threonine-protein kinase